MINQIVVKLNEGGPFFTYPMVVMLIVIIGLFIWGLLQKGHNQKVISLLISFGWFSVAWAFLGHTIGLITAFDSVGAAGELAPKYVAGGLKIALINLVGGSILLLVSRLSVIILIWLQKKEMV
ncbi:MAG: MotA/TolQ/ExbB proton channel family protein [Bacteroidales bacterium]